MCSTRLPWCQVLVTSVSVKRLDALHPKNASAGCSSLRQGSRVQGDFPIDLSARWPRTKSLCAMAASSMARSSCPPRCGTHTWRCQTARMPRRWMPRMRTHRTSGSSATRPCSATRECTLSTRSRPCGTSRMLVGSPRPRSTWSATTARRRSCRGRPTSSRSPVSPSPVSSAWTSSPLATGATSCPSP